MMKHIVFFFLFSFFLLLSSCDRDWIKLTKSFKSDIAPDSDLIYREIALQEFTPIEFNETSRLFYLCKTWGFVKYYHENEHPTIDVDSVLLEYIPLVSQCVDKDEFCQLLHKVINSIQLKPMKGSNPYKDIKDYTLINNRWMNDTICLNDTISQQLTDIFMGHSGIGNSFVWNKSSGAVRQFNEKTYENFENEQIRLLGLFRYWNLINYFYPSKNYMDNSWDRVLYESIPRFISSGEEKQYRMEVYRLTNQLRDSHSSYPALIDGALFGPYRPPFRLLHIDSLFVVNEILAENTVGENIQLGDIVLEIDNKKVNVLFDSLSMFVCGGNEWSNQSFVIPAMLADHDSTTLFTVLRGNDSINIISKNQGVRERALEKGEKIKAREKEVLYRWITDSIAYLNLESITRKNFKRNYSPIQKAKVIILDMRCYPQNLVIMNLADAFVPPKSIFAYGTYADTRYPGMLRQKQTHNPIGNKNYFKGRIIVLVNEWTESFSEYTTMMLQANPQTIVVGSPTSGADGNVSMFEFPGKVTTCYTGLGVYYQGMKSTQRSGIRIDYLVKPTIESIKNNRDIIYEKAIHIAKGDR